MIFYFTGTGNSKYIAEKIASGTAEQIYNITDCVQNGQYAFQAVGDEAIGFVVPVYYLGIPIIVVEFLKKLKIEAKQGAYSFAVLNCGGSAANAESVLQRAFRVKAVFAIETVSNYVPLYKMENDGSIKERLNQGDKDIAKIIEHIGKKDAVRLNPFRGKFPRLSSFAGYSIFKHGRKTKKFTVNQSCISCGLCEKICPRKAISIQNGKPVWTIPQCEICLGCLHRCPARAINYGKKSAGNGRYTNPFVKL